MQDMQVTTNLFPLNFFIGSNVFLVFLLLSGSSSFCDPLVDSSPLEMRIASSSPGGRGNSPLDLLTIASPHPHTAFSASKVSD